MLNNRDLYLGGLSMTQVNMLDVTDDLSKLVNMLETKQEEIIYLTRNGTAVAQMTLIPKNRVTNKNYE